jgi:hypothetical protein
MKMCEDFTQKFGEKITGCCIKTTHPLTLPFSPEMFLPKHNMTVIPHPPYLPDFFRCAFPLFPLLKIPLFWHN